MKSLERVSKWLGVVRVKESGNLIRVTGIDGTVMSKIVLRMWGANDINKYMFNTLTDTSVSLNGFFLPDWVYMLTQIRMDHKTRWSERRTIDRIVHGIMKNTWFGQTVGAVPSIVDHTRLSLLKWSPLAHQMDFLDNFGEKIPRYGLNGLLVGAAPGTGKSLSLDSKIRTPYGWKRMGDITVGSKVIVPDGTVSAVTGVYPQGELDMYRVTFDDGRTTECSDDHLWKITNKNWSPRGQTNWRVVPFKEIRLHQETYGWSQDNRLYIPLPEPEIKNDVELPMDPYLLGVLLGDGSFGKNSLMISSADRFILDEVEKLLPENLTLKYRSQYDYCIVKKYEQDKWKFRCPLVDVIADLGLRGTVSHTKFIPKKYMEASESQKLFLLQGLMDTDGTVDRKTGTPSFCTTSDTLAKQVQELIRSLGGMCKISTKIPKYTYNNEKRTGKLAYILSIRFKEAATLFRLPRKVELTHPDYQYKEHLKLRIRDIEYIGKKEAQCISVDHPEKLYITDDYIVTHNTILSLFVMTAVIPPSVAEVKIIISPKKATRLVWGKTIESAFKKTPTHWLSGEGVPMPRDKCEYYIFNFEQLEQAILLAQQLIAQGRRYFVTVDETHNFADFRSNRTQRLVKLQTLHKNVYFLWLSGSPILKHAAELTSFLKCSDPRFDADAERRFRRIYSTNKGRAGEIFHHRFGQMMGMLIPKSVVSDTKPTVKELPIKLPSSLAKRFLLSTVKEDMRAFVEERVKFYDNQLKNYQAIVNEQLEAHGHQLKSRQDRNRFEDYKKNLKIIMATPDRVLPEILSKARTYERMRLIPMMDPLKRREFRSALSAVKNIKLKVRGEALGKILSKRRSECAAALGIYCKPEEIMKESLSKTLFFASSVYPVKVLESHLRKKGFDPIAVYAETNAQLFQMMEDFEKDPNINPCIATMQSLSEAVPVTAASTLVTLNRPFRVATFEQIIARIDRLGKTFPSTIINVTLDTGDEPNVSSRTDQILAEVREQINALIGPAFAGPDPSESEYQELIDASQEDPSLILQDEENGLI